MVGVVGNIQVESSVFVVVEKSCARSPLAVTTDACGRRDLGESTVAVVPVKETGSFKVGHKQIGISVVVIVPDRYTHSEPIIRQDSRLRCHIRECSVAVVTVKSMIGAVGH